MAKTKREYILATCFLTGAAAIISLVSLGTREWVTSSAEIQLENGTKNDDNSIIFGLFGGAFTQNFAVEGAEYQLTMICLYDKNICALLCGDHMTDNLERLYNHENVSEADIANCKGLTKDARTFQILHRSDNKDSSTERVFINAGLLLSTIIFMCLSALMGLIAAGLAVWNTASNPYQVYLSIFGLYIYNGIAACSLLLALILWGALFAQNLSDEIPTYRIFSGEFQTKGNATLGYSYWINLISLIFYHISIALLCVRNYLISKEPEVNVHIEESTDPVIYLY